jgi:hypothetical protein
MALLCVTVLQLTKMLLIYRSLTEWACRHMESSSDRALKFVGLVDIVDKKLSLKLMGCNELLVTEDLDVHWPP